MNNIKRVHVVFMTHFDFGFTDTASNVLEKYKKEYIPNAIDLAEKLNKDGHKRFIWTLGSFPVFKFLQEAGDAGRRKLEGAVREGNLAWHALAFTTHTELMDSDLADFDFSYAEKLDREFGKNTISAKMTDVPGHTKAFVKKLQAHGIRYLHIGVNDSSMVPEVPATFLWTCGDADVIVQYSGSYGSSCYVEGMEDALEFVFMMDNEGIPTEEEVLLKLDAIQKKYPSAEVMASTLDEYAEKVTEWKDRIPVLNEEIGDTWIHGVASDPLKVMIFRRMLSLKDKWKAENLFSLQDPCFDAFMENLLCVCEHTWGMDYKKFLNDFENWDKNDFKQNRVENIRQYTEYENSFREQRDYLKKAASSLPAEMQKEAFSLISQAGKMQETDQSEWEEAYPGQILTAGGYDFMFDMDGALVRLIFRGKNLVPGSGTARLGYEVYDYRDVMDEYYSYNRNIEQNRIWSEADFGKKGLDRIEGLRHKKYPFMVRSIMRKGNEVRINLVGENDAVRRYGCPASAVLHYEFGDDIRLRLSWQGKDLNKIPEALWLDFNFLTENPSAWKYVCMGEEISPLDVVEGGNRRMHCTEKMICRSSDMLLEIRNPDSPLVSMGGRRLYGGCRNLPDLRKGFSCCLYNNRWDTNFPLWFGDDCSFEYIIKVSPERK